MGIVDGILSKFLGNKSERDIKELRPYVEKTLAEYEKLKDLSNDQLREKSIELKQKVADYLKPSEDKIVELKRSIVDKKIDIHERENVYEEIDRIEKEIDKKIEEILDELLPEAFAVVKDTARRFYENEKIEVTATQFDKDLAAGRDSIEIVNDKAIYYNHWIAGGNEIIWDMVHYDVQIIGGVVLHQGKIAEMATGEGKTLVATFPVFLNALAGRGVHLVTVNNYLSKRDAEWMGPIFEFHGLSVDCIDKHRPNSAERRAAYNADITYGTNNEFGFDYLRDNMAFDPDDLVQRKHHYAIVDEVDSVLIDDARTPLIISGSVAKNKDDDQLFHEYKGKVEKLMRAQKDLVNDLITTAKKLIGASNDKEKEAEGAKALLRAFKGLPKTKALIKFLSEEGNKTLLHKTENIYLAENAKRMPEITDELYFVIDEKNNSVELTEKGINLISKDVSDKDFFILPDIGNEIAEIEKSDLSDKTKLAKKDKLMTDYAIKSERLHTIQQLLKAYALFERDIEYVVMNNKVKIVDEQTGRIMEGRRYSDGLHQAIEAKENVKVEAATQTVATITLQNYFRMYHKLAGMTGTAETEAGEFWSIYKLDVVVIPTNRPIIRDDRNDLVYKTKREKYNAVIDEIIELVKNGRPVLVGTTSVEISELLSRMLKIKGIKHNVLNAKLHQKEAEIVAEAGQSGKVTIATNMAGRGTDIKLSEEVRKAGGLAIIGTERHESRRVDRQLRGRSGRQGDPGSSQFFVSLEDDLMRLFGSDRISGLMDRLGLKEGEVIQHSMISKSIERAQKKVEENNFGIRKRLLEYDDVMNAQREVVYKRRKHALFGERLGVDIANMMYELTQTIVSDHYGKTEFDDFKLDLLRLLSVECPINEKEYLKINPEDIIEKIYPLVIENFKRKEEIIVTQALPVIKDVFERQSHQYQNIVVPITDGQKVFNITTNLERAAKTEGEELLRSYEKLVVLANIDEAWKEHLREMDDLKQSVQNASYEQKDPLLIYKLESFNLFSAMLNKTNRGIISTFMKGQLMLRDPNEVKAAQAPKKLDMSKYDTSRPEMQTGQSGSQKGEGLNQQQPQKTQPVRVDKKVGRNDPCPCGSGKKFKQCHGKDA